MLRSSIFFIFLFLQFQLFAQSKDKDKWDVNNPPGEYKEVTLNLSEGTWMNLDVHPDGQSIVFDLLGDIYSMPITGGKAKVLREGLAWEVQPRFSPDGNKILFTSDAGGGDNIWSMDVNGENAKQITKEKFRLLNNAAWTPDGQFFVARKHFTSQRSLGAGEIWMYHISGGDGIQLTKRKNDQQDVNEPECSADGKYVYYSEDMYPGGFFQYNKDPNKQIYAIKRYDRETGENELVVGGPGGAIRPQLSPDGKWLAFVKRVREKTVLCKLDLKTGQEFSLYSALSKDQQEAWAIFGVFPGYDWMPDGQNLIIWSGGKILKINASTGAATTIPFEVTAKHKLAETVQFKNKVYEDKFNAKVIRHAVTSPDGQQLVFSALGSLWVKDLPDGTPRRLTNAEHLEFEPSFSRDGSKIVYVSWDDEKGGAVWRLDMDSGLRSKMTQERGIYRTPSFHPDGIKIVYRKDGGNQHQGFTFNQKPGIYIKSGAQALPEFVIKEGEYPIFNNSGDRIFYQTGGILFGPLDKKYKSVKLDGEDKKVHFKTKYATRFVPSPDNKWVVFTELFNLYVAPLINNGKEIDLSAKTKAIPVSKLSRDAGINVHWSGDSKEIHWTLGDTYYSTALNRRFNFLPGSLDSIPPPDTIGLAINLEIQTDKPEGTIIFKNARIITMNGDEVIENGTLIVEKNKIVEVGPAAAISIPTNGTVIDCAGKTIMPGLVDVHAHLGAFRYGLSPQKHWQYYANLAYGITTTHDPSVNTEMTFAQSEMVKAGKMIGPRIYSTGTILYGAEGDFKAVINSLDDARSALRRTKAYGAFSVKSYNQPRRDQRQQVIQAARELGIMVYPEGGSFFYHNMTMVADGHTGVEHNIPIAPLHKDVLDFWSSTNTGNTPTLIVNYGGVNGEFYWYQNTNVWEKERMLTFTPRAVIDARSRHRMMIPDEEYQNGHILTSESCNALQNAGVNINLGSHGQIQGIGAHWELWMLAQGGMSNLQALKAATIQGAAYIGMDAEIGSLEKGKLADLIVLEKNPLDNIQHSELVEYTMINGRLYDAATMNEVGNYDKKRSTFYWEQEGSGNGYPLLPGMGLMHSGCRCRH